MHSAALTCTFSYEAVVVIDFYELIIDYLGGATSSSRLLKVQSPLRLRRLTIAPDEGTILAIRRCVYQFYFAKPLLSLLAFVLEELHVITHPSIAPSFHVITFSIVALRIVSVMVRSVLEGLQ